MMVTIALLSRRVPSISTFGSCTILTEAESRLQEDEVNADESI